MGAILLLVGAGGSQYFKPSVMVPDEFTQTQQDAIKELSRAVETMQRAVIYEATEMGRLDAVVITHDSVLTRIDSLQQVGFRGLWDKVSVIEDQVDKVSAQNELIIELISGN